jgi:uncharacterized protein (TIGR02246 family)
MKLRIFLLVFTLSLGPAFCAAAAVTDGEQEILQLDQRRVEAMMANDVATVAGTLAEGLVYVHSDGRQQSKEQLLAAMKSNRTPYRKVTYNGRAVRAVSDTRVLTGTATFEVLANGAPVAFTLRFMAVYVQENGAWKLGAYQSAAIIPPDAAASARP